MLSHGLRLLLGLQSKITLQRLDAVNHRLQLLLQQRGAAVGLDAVGLVLPREIALARQLLHQPRGVAAAARASARAAAVVAEVARGADG